MVMSCMHVGVPFLLVGGWLGRCHPMSRGYVAVRGPMMAGWGLPVSSSGSSSLSESVGLGGVASCQSSTAVMVAFCAGYMRVPVSCGLWERSSESRV